MIDLGEQVFFGDGTDENNAMRMLKEAAKKRCHGIDESRIKLIIKKDRGYITGVWHVQVKEKEYIRMLEAQNAELVRKTEQLERERDAAVSELPHHCWNCMYHRDKPIEETDDYGRTIHIYCDADYCFPDEKNSSWEWRGVPEKEGENDV